MFEPRSSLCLRSRPFDSAAAQEAALELAEDFDWDAVVVDDWFEVTGPAIENEPSAADLSKTK